MITVTESAAKHIKQSLLSRGRGLGIRVGLRKTGCSGLAYMMEFVDLAKDDFVKYDTSGVTVFVKKDDIAYIQDLSIDYVRKGLNEGFEFSNPMEKGRCGCGESIRI